MGVGLAIAEGLATAEGLAAAVAGLGAVCVGLTGTGPVLGLVQAAARAATASNLPTSTRFMHGLTTPVVFGYWTIEAAFEPGSVASTLVDPRLFSDGPDYRGCCRALADWGR